MTEGKKYWLMKSEPTSYVAGIMEICKAGYPDFTAWDSKEHFEIICKMGKKDKA